MACSRHNLEDSHDCPSGPGRWIGTRRTLVRWLSILQGHLQRKEPDGKTKYEMHCRTLFCNIAETILSCQRIKLFDLILHFTRLQQTVN